VKLAACRVLGLSIDGVSSDIQGVNHISVRVKDDAEISLNDHGVNGPLIPRGEAADPMRPQSWIKRIALED
jgi:hypothetical protein